MKPTHNPNRRKTWHFFFLLCGDLHVCSFHLFTSSGLSVCFFLLFLFCVKLPRGCSDTCTLVSMWIVRWFDCVSWTRLMIYKETETKGNEDGTMMLESEKNLSNATQEIILDTARTVNKRWIRSNDPHKVTSRWLKIFLNFLIILEI